MKKCAHELNREFSKEDMQMTNKKTGNGTAILSSYTTLGPIPEGM
jgi:hypothetical protein